MVPLVVRQTTDREPGNPVKTMQLVISYSMANITEKEVYVTVMYCFGYNVKCVLNVGPAIVVSLKKV